MAILRPLRHRRHKRYSNIDRGHFTALPGVENFKKIHLMDVLTTGRGFVDPRDTGDTESWTMDTE